MRAEENSEEFQITPKCIVISIALVLIAVGIVAGVYMTINNNQDEGVVEEPDPDPTDYPDYSDDLYTPDHDNPENDEITTPESTTVSNDLPVMVSIKCIPFI